MEITANEKNETAFKAGVFADKTFIGGKKAC